MYERSVGHNATLILGLTPDTAGRIPRPDADTLKAFGDAIQKRYERPLAAASGVGREVVLTLPKGQVFDAVGIGEEIEKGQRIRSFTVQALVGRRWVTLMSGTSVGHRYIGRLKEPVAAGKVRLVVEGSVGTPSIKQFALYRVGG
jgi:alpha-L-fucosidase